MQASLTALKEEEQDSADLTKDRALIDFILRQGNENVGSRRFDQIG